MQVTCSHCKLEYNDADCSTVCPHGELFPRTLVSDGKGGWRIVRDTGELDGFTAREFPLPMEKAEAEQATWLLTGLANECFRVAGEHGFHQDQADIPLKLCLIHSEISEALEAYRNKKTGGPSGAPIFRTKDGKPEGVAIELADAIIRILDLCGRMGWDIGRAVAIKMAYNENREFMHGRRF